MSTDHLVLRLPNNSRFDACEYGLRIHEQPRSASPNSVSAYSKSSARRAGITHAPRGKIFMDWDVAYGNPVWDKNIQTNGLAYWELTHTNHTTRRKIMTRDKRKYRTYIALFYHECQALGVRITADGPFKVDIRIADLEGLERVQIISIFSDRLGPNAQSRLDNEKLKLKKYTNEAVRHRNILEVVERISSKQFAHDKAHAAGSRKWIRTSSLSMSEYEIMIATAFKVLPVKSVLTTWTRRRKIHCDNCKKRKRETVKHLFCRCMYLLYEAIRTKHHDKVVCEL